MNQCRHTRKQRRAAVVVQVAVASIVLLSFAALAIDTGRLYMARVEVQRAADAAALASVSGYISNNGLSQNRSALQTACTARGVDACSRNNSSGVPMVLSSADVVLGRHSYDNPGAALDRSANARFNAVELTVRRTNGSANGGVDFLFAPIFGRQNGGVTAVARAVMDDRFAGMHLDTYGYPGMMPFTLDVSLYNDMVANGLDEWSYNNGVVNSGDSVREVKLYPWKLKGNGGDPIYESSGAGNFGILQFGGSGTNDIVRQIHDGLTPDEIAMGSGTHELVYSDANGNPVHYDISGTPGMRSAMAAELENKIGQVVGFFVHDHVQGNGTNTTYRNVGVRFGRLMDVRLNGNPPQRRIVIQPVVQSGRWVISRENAPPSGGQIGLLRLVR
jgi:Flp pilus assembly protein TadG